MPWRGRSPTASVRWRSTTPCCNAAYEDQITPIGPAVAIFTDDVSQPNGLSYTDGYKVVFLAFPFEAYGSATDKAALMTDVMTFFGP